MMPPKNKNARQGISTSSTPATRSVSRAAPKNKNARQGISTLFHPLVPHVPSLAPKNKNARQGLSTTPAGGRQWLCQTIPKKQKCPPGHFDTAYRIYIGKSAILV